MDRAHGLEEPSIFIDKIEPRDIKQGQLGDCWFMCALACLAERPTLVERLFITKSANALGIYRVKLCKNGEWVTVTVDDYFPCYPMSGPIFSRANGNELWVLILEKAYAKLHGNYYHLRGGYASEGMMDLTGCPTAVFILSDPQVQQMARNDELWRLMRSWDEAGFLMSGSVAGEDRWSEAGINPNETLPNGLIPGHAYTILLAKDVQRHRLIQLRNPWGSLEWTGDWSDSSPQWTP